MPVELSDDEFEETTAEAMASLEDEADREVIEAAGLMDSRKRKGAELMSDADLACLRKRFPFLVDLSDRFVRSQTTSELLKLESTAMKMKMIEQSRDFEDRLASNKASLEERECKVPAGFDNRWDKLHPGRFLGGASCTTKKLWLEARKAVGLSGDRPVGCYDMGAVGMGGFVTSRGWIELHNPGSSRNALKLFSINNCAAKVSSSKNSSKNCEDDIEEIVELGEFKLALRTMRVAASMVMPWNFAYVALENFLQQTNFCSSDLQGIDQPAKLLSQFVDYVIKENANRWRDGSPFLDTGSLKATWDAFYGAKPQAQLSSKSKKLPSQMDSKNAKFQRRHWVDICWDWNIGKCTKQVGSCTSLKGTPLRHVCNFQPDRFKQPNSYCEKNHTRISSH